jgi:hypothetical protein
MALPILDLSVSAVGRRTTTAKTIRFATAIAGGTPADAISDSRLI